MKHNKTEQLRTSHYHMFWNRTRNITKELSVLKMKEERRNKGNEKKGAAKKSCIKIRTKENTIFRLVLKKMGDMRNNVTMCYSYFFKIPRFLYIFVCVREVGIKRFDNWKLEQFRGELCSLSTNVRGRRCAYHRFYTCYGAAIPSPLLPPSPLPPKPTQRLNKYLGLVRERTRIILI